MSNCSCRFDCTLFAIISSTVLGVAAAFLWLAAAAINKEREGKCPP